MKEKTTLGLEKSVMDRARLEAEEENRPLSNYIETILKKHFKNIDEKKSRED